MGAVPGLHLLPAQAGHVAFRSKLTSTVLPLTASTKSIATSLVMLSPLRFLLVPEVKVSW